MTSADAQVILTPGINDVHDIAGMSYWFESGSPFTAPDDSAELSEQQLNALAQQAWSPAPSSVLNLGCQSSPLWLRFQLHSELATAQRWFITLAWPMLKNVKLYVKDRRTQQWLSDPDQQSASEYHDPFPHVLGLNLAPNAQLDIYLRVESTANLVVPVALHSELSYRRWAELRTLFIGVLFGLTVAMLSYNLSLYVCLRDRQYALYCLYVLVIIIYMASVSGIGLAYFWRADGWFNQHVYGLSSTGAFLCATLFSREFLRLKALGGPIERISYYSVVAWGTMVALMLFIDHPALFYLSDVMGYVSCFSAIGLSIYRWYHGDIFAKYLSLAWGPLTITTAVMLLGLAGVIEYQPWVVLNQIGCFGFEVILLSMAIAERVNQDRRERLDAQEQALQMFKRANLARNRELQSQQQWLKLERESKEILSQEVENKTRELQAALHALQQANSELSQRSNTDALTQVANRRHLDERLGHTIALAKAKQLALTVMMVDIDHFKQVNDAYGHQLGDVCLARVATELKRHVVDDHDLVARYGGEEFCVLLLGIEAASAYALAEAMRRAIYTLPLDNCPIGKPLSVSIGLCTAVPDAHTKASTLLYSADHALYQAKSAGRNQVMSQTLLSEADGLPLEALSGL